MADITLTVGVDYTTSYKDLSQGINSIVRTINKNPPKIKVEFDPRSLTTMQKQITDLSNSLSDSFKRLDVGGLESAGSSIASLATSLSQLTSSTSGVNAYLDSISSGMTRVAESLEKLVSAIPESGSALSKMGKEGAAGLEEMYTELQQIQELVVSLNQKDFSVQNVFSYKKSGSNRTDRNLLELYRQEATELLKTVEDLYAAVWKLEDTDLLTLSAASSGRMDEFFTITGQYRGEVKYAENIAGATTLSSIKKTIGSLQVYYNTLKDILNTASTLGSTDLLPDETQYQAAIGAVDQYEKYGDKTQQAITKAAEATTQLADAQKQLTNNETDITTGQTEKISSMCSEASSLLDELRIKIEQTFDLSTVNMNESSILSVINDIKEQLSNLKVVVNDATVQNITTSGETTTNIVSTAGTGEVDENTSALKANQQAKEDAAVATAKLSSEEQKAIASVKESAGATREDATAKQEDATATKQAAESEQNMASAAKSSDEAVRSSTQAKKENAQASEQSVSSAQKFAEAEEKMTSSAHEASKAMDEVQTSFRSTDIESATKAFENLTGVSANEAAQLAEALSDADVTVTKISSSMELVNEKQSDFVKFTIQGKTALDQSVQYIATFNKEEDELVGLSEKISQGFKESAEETKASTDSIKEEYDAIIAKAQELGNLRVDTRKAELTGAIDQSSLTEASARISTLQTEYDQMIADFRSKYPDFDTSKLSSTIDTTEKKLNDLEAKYAATTEALSKQIVADYNKEVGNPFVLDTTKITNDFRALQTATTDTVDAVQRFVDSYNALDSAIQSGNPDKIVAAYKEYKEALADAQAQIKINVAENKALEAAQKAEAEAQRQANKEKKESEQLNREVETSYKNISSGIASGNKALKNYATAQHSSNEANREAYKAIQDNVDELERLKNVTPQNATEQREFVSAVNEANQAISENTKLLRADGSETQTLASRLGKLTTEFSSWFGVSRLIMESVRAIREMISASMEIESSMAQIQIVTGATGSELEEFFSTASEMAQELGQSITDVASSIETFSRLGYDLPDASMLAEYATILSNVASVTTEEATTGLTSVIKGFGLEVEDAEHVSDVLVEVGQNYAVSAEEILEAMERSSAAMAATNTTFEQSAAIVAAGEKRRLGSVEIYFQRTHLIALVA